MDKKKKGYIYAILAALAGFVVAILNASAFVLLIPVGCCRTNTHPLFLLVIYLIEILLITFLKNKGIGGVWLKSFNQSLLGLSVLFIILISVLFFGEFCPRCDLNPIIPASGFLINQETAYYSHSTGNLTIMMAQAWGETWNQWALVYVPFGSSLTDNGIPENSTYLNWVSEPGPLLSGYITNTLTIPVSGAVPVGTRMQGTLWACYVKTGPVGIMQIPCVDQGQTVYYVQIGSIERQAI